MFGNMANPIVLLILLLIILLIFGRGRIPGLMGDMAKGINAFRSGLREGKADEEEATATAAAEAEPAPVATKTIEHDETSEPVTPAAKKPAAKKPAAKKPAAKKPAAKKPAAKKTGTASKAKKSV